MAKANDQSITQARGRGSRIVLTVVGSGVITLALALIHPIYYVMTLLGFNRPVLRVCTENANEFNIACYRYCVANLTQKESRRIRVVLRFPEPISTERTAVGPASESERHFVEFLTGKNWKVDFDPNNPQDAVLTPVSKKLSPLSVQHFVVMARKQAHLPKIVGGATIPNYMGKNIQAERGSVSDLLLDKIRGMYITIYVELGLLITLVALLVQRRMYWEPAQRQQLVDSAISSSDDLDEAEDRLGAILRAMEGNE